MFKIGRLCLKIAGRDAGLKCIIIDKLDDNYVLIDGQTRRRKCNINHLEPLDKVLKVSKGASHEDVVKELKKQGIEIKEKTKRSKKTKEAKTEEKPEAKGTVKKQETPAKPKKEEVKKAEAESKKTVVKKAKAKPKAKKTTEKVEAKAKAKTTNK